MSDDTHEPDDNSIAIIGMAARLPGARNVDEYWKNLREGVESMVSYSDEELVAAGVSPAMLADPHYVKRGAPMPDMDHFDADFFGFSPKEAAVLDPQQRHFLECSWEAFEDAGYPPETFNGAIGVFAGCGASTYLMFNLLSNPDLVDDVGFFLLRHTGNDKDFLSTRVSYLFDLKGPSINIQTACSTSLVAVHIACQHLLSGECDLALAGGSTIEQPHHRGYLYKQGEILSPDGHCRSFDRHSEGTVFGSGCGAVILRRLADALEAGDRIYAVIKGSAVNNDGSDKVSYLAPGVEGQTAAVSEALSIADVTADTIDYVETHGTATPMGDPIEIAALTDAFRDSTDKTGYCAIASVKSNIGHLDTAAGVAGLIKTALALYHREIPASLHYDAPNPNIEFERTPFFVNTQLRAWTRGDHPRRAGVNALGVGGTNAHAVLEEPPPAPASGPSSRPYQLLLMSAKNRASLDDACDRLADHLERHPEQPLADVAFTLQTTRRAFDQRRVVAVKDHQDAVEALRARDPRRVFTHTANVDRPSAVFMFPGGGAQYVGMARELYETQPVFRQHIDRGLIALEGQLDVDLRSIWFGDPQDPATVATFERPSIQLPAIFILEYALAQLWMEWGVEPKALIGHSMGENTAACLASVLSFEDALGLVVLRGQLFERVPEGGMLSVPLPREDLEPLLGDTLDLATVNSPGLCAVSGPTAGLAALADKLKSQDIEAQRIKINIAAHSRMLEPILAEFHAYLAGIRLAPPKIPFISNRTGDWITDEQATSPTYWVEHLRNTVHFSDGVQTLLEQENRVFIEVGPGKTLASLVRQQPAIKPVQSTLGSLRHPEEKVSDLGFFTAALGRVWASGGDVELDALREGEQRVKVRLPTYAFQHQPYYFGPGSIGIRTEETRDRLQKLSDPEDWYWLPAWKRRGTRRSTAEDEGLRWLVFLDDVGIGRGVVDTLRRRGHAVVTVEVGDRFHRVDDEHYLIAPEQGREGYESLLRDLTQRDRAPNRIVHLWMLTQGETFRPGSTFFHRNQEYGFYSLMYLAQAAGNEGLAAPVHLTAVSNGMQRVHDEPLPYPAKSTLLGPIQVIPREFAGFTCASIDLAVPSPPSRRVVPKRHDGPDVADVVDRLTTELLAEPANAIVAYRDGRRYERTYEQTAPESPLRATAPAGWLRPGGTYLVTGGLGGLGLLMAEHLASKTRLNLVLIGRAGLPNRDSWDKWIERHGPHDAMSQKIAAVRRLEAQGAKVTTAGVSVTDRAQLERVVEDAERDLGPIRGVIHAAGALRDDLLQLKNAADVEEVFAPKVHGTRVLDEIFARRELDFMVLFSSTSSIVAPAGQVDYVAANAYLNAYAQSRHDASRRVVAIDWGIWNEVGMAADAAQQMGATAAPREDVEASHPLFQRRRVDRAGGAILTATLSPSAHWILDEHRTKAGHAVWPGTGFLELCRAALREHGETRPFEVHDLVFLRALHVADNAEKEVRVRLRPEQSAYLFDVQSKYTLVDGRVGWETHAQAELHLVADATAEPVDIPQIDERCQVHRVADNPQGIRSEQEQHLLFGPRWRVLRQVAYGEHEALARLELPSSFTADLDDYGLHPGLLDFATGYAMRLIDGYSTSSDSLWVPLTYKRVRVYAPLTRRIWSHVRTPEPARVTDDFASFDVVITDDAGRVLVEVESLTIKRLTEAIDFAMAKPSASELEFDTQRVGDRSLSPAEAAFAHNLERGILPAEGTAALERVLTCESVPQVVVTSLHLERLLEQAAQPLDAPGDDAQKFARPDLDSEYVAPRDEVERSLVEIWQEILGVDNVGVLDSFFDLGGHSLIAVRLFAKIKKLYDVEYAISVLFEAPTVEGCARLIKEATGITGESPLTGDTPARSEDKPRFRYLVRMDDGRHDDQPPFFLVAGMFGNVLNLRQLAQHLGRERPFYGIQAKGLHGDDEPHESFEDMARDYLEEVRQVQPTGPYLIGGFSGGGMAAFEMAHQLTHAGEPVQVLALLDTPLHHDAELSAADKFRIHTQEIQRQGLGYLSQKLKSRYLRQIERLRGSAPVDEVEVGPAAFRSEVIRAAFDRACDRYQVPDYAGEVVLFRPRLDERYVLGPGRVLNRDKEYVYADNGWGRHVKRLDVCEVPGDHDGMVLEPNVRILVEELRQRMRVA
ncbi:MAG: KR domain-containing protein [Myxococcales bacterium FL481]|nr:MAG: KR domain-containing protein [Myxococcales bacterium FL481]